MTNEQQYATVITMLFIFIPLFIISVFVVTKVAIFIARLTFNKNYPKIKQYEIINIKNMVVAIVEGVVMGVIYYLILSVMYWLFFKGKTKKQK